jgi:hypothetical protein
MALVVVALAALGEAGMGAGGRAGRLTLVPIVTTGRRLGSSRR